MKFKTACMALLFETGVAYGTGVAYAQFPPQIKNVIVIFQENRTPDNLFHGLMPACPLPQNPGGLDACIPNPVTTGCYDISPCGLSDQKGAAPVAVMLKPVPLSGSVDPDHSHNGFNNMCNPDPNTLKCRNDGAWKTSSPAGTSYGYVENTPVTNYDGSAGHLLEPYMMLARQYGWANFMFQTNQGPSFPAHQFMFSGTSAPTAEDDAKSTFVSENFNNKVVSNNAGCLALENATNAMISPSINTPDPGCTLYADSSVQECPIKNTALSYPGQSVGTFCFDHPSMANVLDPHAISWKYFAPSPGSIWTAPDAIKKICEPGWVDPNGNPKSGLECTGAEWKAKVDTNNYGTDILRDIEGCRLANVNWVIPNGAWSDHAGPNDLYGPSWVAAIVNAIGSHRRCASVTKDEGQTYWENTAIVITWDDWGGWSDNQPAPYATKLPCNSDDCQADYQYGFRVPLIVVSAYTPQGYINNDQHDFGSVLRMIEGINHLKEGQLGFADKRATTDLSGFFKLTQPRPYLVLPAEKDADFFLNYSGAAIDPDDD